MVITNRVPQMLCPVMITKMLIVDDHAPTRSWLRSRLSHLAQEITEAKDGGEAVQAFDAHQPEWVLMDVEMKPMDGITATRLIRDKYPEARILVVSSHNEPSIRAAAVAAGACQFVQKEDLWQVRQILEGQQSAEGGKG